MSTLLLDTDAFAWTPLRATRSSPAARAAIATATQTHLSAISLFEITRKVRIGGGPP